MKGGRYFPGATSRRWIEPSSQPTATVFWSGEKATAQPPVPSAPTCALFSTMGSSAGGASPGFGAASLAGSYQRIRNAPPLMQPSASVSGFGQNASSAMPPLRTLDDDVL